jgi:hypothetical protein
MRKYILPFFILFFSFPILAQQSLTLSGPNENDNYDAVLNNQRAYLNKLYYAKVGDVDELINGRDYFPYYIHIKITPILFFDKSHTSSVILNGRNHTDMNLDYDTNLDELIYTDSGKVMDYRVIKIALNKDPVESFSFYFGTDTLLFRPFRSEEGKIFNLPEGFYEVPYDGKSKYIIKHQSFLSEKQGLYEYSYSVTNYIMSGGEFSKIKSFRNFIELFGDKSEAIRKFMRTSNIRIRKGDKKQIVMVLKYYDNLVAAEKLSK